MKFFVVLFSLINLLLYSSGVVPNWDIPSSSIDLMPSSTSCQYRIAYKNMFNLKAELKKKITISGNKIEHSNLLYINDGTTGIPVDFENIESVYRLDKINYAKIICPKGSYHPYDADNRVYKIPSGFSSSEKWDLKCYFHHTGHFIVFYLYNGYKCSYVIDLEHCNNAFNWIGDSQYSHSKVINSLYDYKLQDCSDTANSADETLRKYDNQWVKYKMASLGLENNNIVLKNMNIEFHLSNEYWVINGSGSKVLTEQKTYSKAYFTSNSGYNDFYFITYNNYSDFISGYTSSSFSGTDYHNINSVNIKLNSESPFQFIDEVEIKEMNFISENKYLYYSIYNKITNKTYHGIYVVKLDKIMFNTDETINTFIPYSSNSMLAITDNKVYKICALKNTNGDDCIEECSSGRVIRDSQGNKCGTSCDDVNKYLLIPDDICLNECDNSIYISNSTKHCGLCKDMDSSKPYRFIGGTECLSEIPFGGEEYNSKLHLLKCKSGFILNGNTCIPHCYTTCSICSEFSENPDSQKCINCSQGYYLEGENCKKIIIPTTIITNTPLTTIPIIQTTIITNIPTTIITNIPTTIITNTPTIIISTLPAVIDITIPKVECINEKCLACNEESNKLNLCLSCDEAKGYKKVNYTLIYTKFLDCIKPNDPKFKNYYFNETLNEYRPCYKTCKTCLKGGDAKANYCLECENGYMFRPGNNIYNNCVAFCEFYYLSSYNQYKCLNNYICPEEAKYYIKDKKSCIDDCKKDSEYKYLYNGICIKQCPLGTNSINNICIFENKNKCHLGKNELYLGENNTLNIIETRVKSYVSEFNYTNYYISLYENQNYNIIIYKDSNCIKELSLEMPKVDFKLCYNKVQKEYNISENLIIVIVDKKELNQPKSFYSFYHPLSGIKLDAEKICSNDTITVVESLNSILDKNNTNYETMTSLTSQSVNIFDLNDPFYTDICFQFDNPLKKDIPLNDRIKTLYPDVELCDEGCQYKGINLVDMTTTCDCKFNDIANNNLIKDNTILSEGVGKILDLINSSNILVFKCIKNVFNKFNKSIGAMISLGLIGVNITLIFIYFFMDSIKSTKYIFNLTTDYISFLSNSNIKIINFPPKRRIEKINTSNKNEQISTVSNSQTLLNKKKKLNTITIHKNKKNNIIISSKNKGVLNTGNKKYDSIESKIKINSNKKNHDKKFFEEYLSKSIDDMEFDDAVVLDKRTYCEHMIENIIEDQIITSTFIAQDPIKPRSIKIMLFVLNLILYFVVNGLFFSEKVISELYNAKEEDENFFSYIPRSIDRIIYTTIVSIVVGIITDFFFIEEKKIKGIFRREKSNINILKEQIIKLILDLKKRYIAFIIVVSIILIISFFYLLCFNYVYPYTQIEWLKVSISIMIIMQILYLLKCILETSFLFLSYKLKSEKMYKISKILD